MGATWRRSALFHEVLRLLRFGFVGLLASATYAGVTFGLLDAGVAFLPSTVFAYMASFLVSYFGHFYFTFRTNVQHRSVLAPFLSVSALSFVVTFLLNWAFDHFGRFPHWVAVATVLVVIPTINYVAHRFWVFTPRPSQFHDE